MQSTTAFEKDFFKLLNNAYYGKTCENIRNRVDIELVKDKDRAEKLHTNPRFKHETRFDENLAALHMRRTNMKFDKPIYIGATVLELSKLVMYEFYYNVLQPYFGERNIEICYTDTDSYVLKLKTDDLTRDLKNLRYHFDFSNFPKDHELYDPTNTKVPGKFKVETGAKDMTEFISLRSKMYSYKTNDNAEEKRLKGISKNVVKNSITFDNYLDALYNQTKYNHTMRTLGSEKHDMYLKEVNKVSLSSYDDKRWIDENKVNTFPYGYSPSRLAVLASRQLV